MAQVYYGGQAVMEGVMFQGPHGKTIACRKKSGEIVYKIADVKPLKERNRIFGWPIVRGCVSFVFSMISGMRDLTWSAAQSDEEESETLTTKDIVLAVLLAVVLTLVFFVGVPVFLATWAYPYIGDFGRSLLEGVLRGCLFLGYIVAIRRMSEIKRLFAYHGAEHKTINALEHGEELTPENVKKYSCIHVRCGTSFILMVMILMIIVFTFVGQTTALARTAIKICMMPLIAGLSYELYRLPLRFPSNPAVRLLVAPGLAMQRLTTAEPDLAQLEVAIQSLAHVPGFAEDYPEVAARLAARAEAEAAVREATEPVDAEARPSGAAEAAPQLEAKPNIVTEVP